MSCIIQVSMKKILSLFFILLFCLPLVFGQTANTEPIDRLIEKIVVKEHFTTRQDIKLYLDTKAVEYEKATKNMIIESFRELDDVIDQKMNKFVVKIALSIGSAIFFFVCLAYLVFISLEKKRRMIEELNKPVLKPLIPEPIITTPKTISPVEQPLNKPESNNLFVPEVNPVVDLEVATLMPEIPILKPVKPVFEEKKQDYQLMLKNAQDQKDLKDLKKSLMSDWDKTREEIKKFKL